MKDHTESPLEDLPRHRPRRPPRHRLTLNVTAMIDVVFLLLIYFLAVTNFKLGEEVYRLDLPERGAAEAADPFQLDEEPLRIRVASIDGAVVAYRITIDGPYESPGTFAELFDFLLARQLTPASPHGLFSRDHPIIIEPTGAAHWEHVIGAFNAAAKAEYSNISFREPAS